jgi:hypothetical protein
MSFDETVKPGKKDSIALPCTPRRFQALDSINSSCSRGFQGALPRRCVGHSSELVGQTYPPRSLACVVAEVGILIQAHSCNVQNAFQYTHNIAS